MKNIIIFLFVVLTFAGFSVKEINDIAAQWRLGEAYLKDTLSGSFVTGRLWLRDSLTTNNLNVRGNMTMADASYLQWGAADALYISGQINELLFYANTHTFNTQYGNRIAALDSSTGLYVDNGNIVNDNFTQLGSSAPQIKTKLVKVYIDTIVQTNTAAHSLTNYRNIINYDCKIWDDSSNKYLPLGYNSPTGMATGTIAYIDATNCNYYWSGSAGNIKRDTAYFYITYTQ